MQCILHFQTPIDCNCRCIFHFRSLVDCFTRLILHFRGPIDWNFNTQCKAFRPSARLRLFRQQRFTCVQLSLYLHLSILTCPFPPTAQYRALSTHSTGRLFDRFFRKIPADGASSNPYNRWKIPSSHLKFGRSKRGRYSTTSL